MNPVINLCEAPYGADPTGRRDCTEAVLQALDDITRITSLAYRQGLAEVEELPDGGHFRHQDGVESHKDNGEVRCSNVARLPFVPTLFFPAGTFLVRNTLCYRHRDLINTYGLDLNEQIRIRGEGVDRTIIRLQDNAPGFGPGARKPVLSYMPGEKSNVSMSNYCENLTINCGRGNPGAVGLDFFANNSGAVRHVKVVSEDGQGVSGVQLGHGNYSGILIKHVEVVGFDHGLHIDSGTATMFAHAEDVALSGQRVSGVTAGAISLSLRKIRTRGVPVAVTCASPVGLTVLVDSELEGTGPVAIQRQAGFLYVSNVIVKGFAGCGTRNADVPGSPPSGGRVDGPSAAGPWGIGEWVYPRAVAAAGPGQGMPRLPIEDTPVWRPAGASAGIRAFGAIGNGVNDDSPAIQRALDSGAAEICFEPGRYLLNRPVVIPSHVEHIDFSFSDLVAGIDLKRSDREGFVITGRQEDQPLFIERLFAWEQWSGQHCSFTHAGTRTVCFKDMHTQTLKFYRNTVPGGKVFFDNVATTAGLIPGTAGHGRCAVSFKGQKVWARQLNPERGEPMILNDGSDFVLLGYKSEGRGVVVRTLNGGRTEVLGGVINIGGTGEVAFVAEDSQQRISTASQGWLPRAFHRIAVREIVEGKTTEIISSDMPSRGYPPERGPQYVVPLYGGNSACGVA